MQLTQAHFCLNIFFNGILRLMDPWIVFYIVYIILARTSYLLKIILQSKELL
jgi:hypothetical protein